LPTDFRAAQDALVLTKTCMLCLLQDAEDDYSLTVNLRRLYQLQLAVNVADSTLFTDLKELLDDFTNLDDEVLSPSCLFLLQCSTLK
jgi:hypothetical protein